MIEVGMFLRPLSTSWMNAFPGQHPQLQTKVIEAARVKDVGQEQILAFNDEFHPFIREKNIKLQNIYNSDATGTRFNYSYTD